MCVCSLLGNPGVDLADVKQRVFLQKLFERLQPVLVKMSGILGRDIDSIETGGKRRPVPDPALFELDRQAKGTALPGSIEHDLAVAPWYRRKIVRQGG